MAKEPQQRYFPRWMVRLDPILGEAEQSDLFVFFRERKKRVGGVVGRTAAACTRRFAGASPSFLAVLCVLGICLFPLLPLALLAAIVVTEFQRLPSDTNRKIGTSVSEMFSVRHSHPLMSQDLWSCGTTGGDILKAYYLEARSQESGIALLLICIGVPAAQTWLLVLGDLLWTWQAAPVILSACALGAAVALTVVSNRPLLIARSHLMRLSLLWWGDRSSGRKMDRWLRRQMGGGWRRLFLVLLQLAAFGIGMVMLGAEMSLVFLCFDRAQFNSNTSPGDGWTNVALINSWLCLVCSGFLLYACGVVRAEGRETVRHLLRQADEAFDWYVRDKVLKTTYVSEKRARRITLRKLVGLP